MSILTCNKRGISLVEVLVAIIVVSIGVISALSLQPPAWRLAAKSDYLGRAAGILSQEMETKQAIIMNRCQAMPANSSRSINVSGQANVIAGDAIFNVQTNITDISPVTANNSIWQVNVTVTWPPLNNTGITEHLVVTRQDRYRFPAGCL